MSETLKLRNLRVVYLPEWEGEDPVYSELFEHVLHVDTFPAEIRDRIISFVRRIELYHPPPKGQARQRGHERINQ